MNTMPELRTQKYGFHMGASAVAELLGVAYYGDEVSVNGISTDSRQIVPGQMFIALKGPRFDGHDFVQQVMEQGAVACLVEHRIEGVNCIVVDDTRLALGKLAAAWRSSLAIPVIGVTGSNGKTTVKEMLAGILSQQGTVLATRGNLNNDIGMPLTLLEMDERYDYAVIEMGANHPGEIEYLTWIAHPDVALITNAGMAHLEGFGSLQGVARGKGEIYQGLGTDGIAVINNDDQFSGYWKQLNQDRNVITFGMTSNATVSATSEVKVGVQQLTISSPAGVIEVNLKLLGRHNVMNALAAVSAAIAIKIPPDAIRTGLEKLVPVKGRLQLKVGLNGSRIIDDTYNANPTSLDAALDVLAEFPGRHFLALGDMGELGEQSASLHRTAGLQAKDKGVDRLYTLGPLSRCAAEKFGDQTYCFSDQDKMIEKIKNDLAQDVTLLVKGSRLMQMERVVAACVTGENR